MAKTDQFCVLSRDRPILFVAWWCVQRSISSFWSKLSLTESRGRENFLATIYPHSPRYSLHLASSYPPVMKPANHVPKKPHSPCLVSRSPRDIHPGATSFPRDAWAYNHCIYKNSQSYPYMHCKHAHKRTLMGFFFLTRTSTIPQTLTKNTKPHWYSWMLRTRQSETSGRNARVGQHFGCTAASNWTVRGAETVKKPAKSHIQNWSWYNI